MKKLTFLFAVTIAVISLTACGSTKEIPTDLTSAQLIQLGQNCYEKNDYDGALRYYKASIQRYGMDNNVYVETKYEMGHVFLRSKKYEEAYATFTEILGLYENASASALPAEYKKLSEICISQIPEKKLAELQNN